jgi:hypothetical protein
MARGGGTSRTIGRVAAPAMGFALLSVLLAVAAAAQSGIVLRAAINGRDARGISSENPVALDPNAATRLGVNITNQSARDVSIKIIRVRGIVMGITFYSHDTLVGLTVPAGAQEVREFDLDLFGLRDQAVGLIPSNVSVISSDRETLAEEDFVADVQGSLRSTYGIFGLVVAAGTATALFRVLRRLATHRLPVNRWQRAMRFVTVGTGLGLTLVFTLSALRIFAPATGTAILLVAGSILAFFVIGYLTPTPRVEEEEEEEEEYLEGAEVLATGAATPAAEFGSVQRAPTPAAWTTSERGPQRASGADEDEERVIRLDDVSEGDTAEDSGPEPQRVGSKETILRPAGRTSDDSGSAPPRVGSKETIARPAGTSLDDAEPERAAPSKETIARPAGTSLDDAEPERAAPSKETIARPAGTSLDDAEPERAAPSKETIARPAGTSLPDAGRPARSGDTIRTTWPPEDKDDESPPADKKKPTSD